MPIKYKFIVEYTDGSFFYQNDMDTSVVEPGIRSAYFDIPKDEDGDPKNVKNFSLVGEDHSYTVNLEDGHFEVDGVSFWMHEQNFPKYRLVFWRRHTHTFTQSLEETSHIVVFRFGWQATDEDGKNHQQVMQIL